MHILPAIKKLYFGANRCYLRFMFPFVKRKTVTMSLKEAYDLIGNTQIDVSTQEVEDFIYPAGDGDTILSLIVPAYNEEKNIRKCLDGLCSQKTKYKYEVIVLDNASFDSTPSILASYADKEPFRVITIKKNRGGSVARNIGIKNAKGKYIGFVDADDRISENFVERLVGEALKYDSDIVKCAFRYDFAGSYSPKVVGEYQRYSEGLGTDIMRYDGYIWDAIYKRELWSDIRYPEECWYEDIIIKMILFRKCKRFSYIPETMYDYYINPNSTSKKQQNDASTKCLEQLWLAMFYADYSINRMNIIPDQPLFVDLLHELGDMLYIRIKQLSQVQQEAAFIISSDLIEQYRRICRADCEMLKDTDKKICDAFLNKSFVQWKMACQIKKCESAG